MPSAHLMHPTKPQFAEGEVVMQQKTPRNEEGQPPTKDPKETVARLEEKKRGAGGANQERIEDQEREVSSDR